MGTKTKKTKKKKLNSETARRIKAKTGDKRKTARRTTSKNYIIAEVADMMARGTPQTEIVQHAKDKYGVTKRTADSYIREAQGFLVDLGEEDVRSQLTELRMKLRQLYDRAIATDHDSFALQVLEKQAALCGLSFEQGSDNMLMMLEKLEKLDGPSGNMRDNANGADEIITTFKGLFVNAKTRQAFISSIKSKHTKGVPKKQLPPGDTIDGEFKEL